VSWAFQEITGPRGTPNTERFLEFLGNSLQLALLTAVVCVLASIFIANGSRFVSGRTTGLAARLTAVGYAVPGPVVAMGVVLSLVALDDVLEGIGLDLPGTVATGSLIGLVYAYSIRFLAPGLNAIEAGMAQVPEEVTASARSLGVRPATIVRRIHTPLARTSVATGAVLVAVDALKELPIALLLRPIGFNTLPIWTFNLATESRFEQAALPALAIIVVAMIPVALLSRQLSRGADRV
jgi:iron(III) transport system permease protein